MSLNNCTISGRLTDEPKTNTTSTGTMVASFSLAVNEFYNQKEHVSYINCTAFGKIAERLQKFHKGRAIAVVGSLRQERWEDKSGNKQSKVSVMVSRIEDLEWNNNKNSSNKIRGGSSVMDTYTDSENDFYDDDIPF